MGVNGHSNMRRRQRGVALLTVLWIVAILMILASTFAFAVQTDARLAASYVQRTRATWLAEAGLQRAFIELRDTPQQFTAMHEYAGPTQPWVLYLDSLEESDLGLADGRFLVTAIDEASRINLNFVDEEVLQNLLADEPELVDAILDWRDEDDSVRLAGAESDYYASLAKPYMTRNAPFETVSELMLLRDVTAGRFFGPGGLSPLANLEQLRDEDYERTPLTDLFTVSSYDENLDLSGAQRLNLNDVTAEELVQQFEDILTQQEAEAIVNLRDGGQAGQVGQVEMPYNSGPVSPNGMMIPGAGGGALAPPGGRQMPGGMPGGGMPGSTMPGGLPGGGMPGQMPGQPGGQPGAQPGGQPGAPGDEADGIEHVADLLQVIDREKLAQIYDRLTATDDVRLMGLINLNTASAEVLAALPGMDASLADIIAAARMEQPFETVGDLLRLTEITEEVFRQVAPLLTTRSMALRLTAQGSVGEGDRELAGKIEALVVTEVTPQQSADPSAPAGATDPSGVPQRTLRLVYRRVDVR